MQMLRLRANALFVISLGMVVALIIFTAGRLSGSTESSRSMQEVSSEVVAAFTNDRTELSGDRYLKKYYGLNASDYDATLLYFPITNMDAQELLLIKLADTSQAETVSAAMESRRQTQIGIYEGYAPEQLALCENAVLDVQGNYILYVVHEDADRIDSIFRESLK